MRRFTECPRRTIFSSTFPNGTRPNFERRTLHSNQRHRKCFPRSGRSNQKVCNGGFSQYFLNSSCETASLVSEALETIGAPKAAVICRRAIAAAFPTGLPERREDISAAAADFSNEVVEALEPLTIEFFKCPDNLADLLFAYVSKHPEEFGETTESGGLIAFCADECNRLIAEVVGSPSQEAFVTPASTRFSIHFHYDNPSGQNRCRDCGRGCSRRLVAVSVSWRTPAGVSDKPGGEG